VQEVGGVLANYSDLSMIEIDRQIPLFDAERAFLRNKDMCNNGVAGAVVFYMCFEVSG